MTRRFALRILVKPSRESEVRLSPTPVAE
jgi:hypothetical protein